MRRGFVLFLLMIFLIGATLFFTTEWTRADAKIEYISPEEARESVQSGRALLVCSYGDEVCRSFHLEGAIFLSELKSRLSSLSRDQELIFYCG